MLLERLCFLYTDDLEGMGIMGMMPTMMGMMGMMRASFDGSSRVTDPENLGFYVIHD